MRLVNTAAATWIPSARRSSSACEEISIAHAASPPSSISRNVRWRSIASGVVRTTARSSPPTTDLTVPSSPHCAARAPRAARGQEGRRRLAVGPGDPGDAQRAPSDRRRTAPRRRAIAARTSSTSTSGTPSPSGRCDDERRRAARDRVGREVVPVAGEAGDAEEQGAGTDEPVVEGRGRRCDHVGPVPEQLAERHRRGQSTSAPGGAYDGPRWRSERRSGSLDADGHPGRPRHERSSATAAVYADLFELRVGRRARAGRRDVARRAARHADRRRRGARTRADRRRRQAAAPRPRVRRTTSPRPAPARWPDAPGVRLTDVDRPAADLVAAFRAAYPPGHPDHREEPPERTLADLESWICRPRLRPAAGRQRPRGRARRRRGRRDPDAARCPATRPRTGRG